MSFIKRHKILFILFAVSIFLMIKNSSIPYFFAPPAIISFIFDAPKSDFFSGMAQMIDIFTSAYVTSLVFYYMVDYLPAIKQEKKAKEIIAPAVFFSFTTGLYDFNNEKCSYKNQIRYQRHHQYCNRFGVVENSSFSAVCNR